MAQVNREADVALAVNFLVALSVAQDSETDVERDGDQRRAAGLGGLVTFLLAKSRNASVDGHANQAIGDRLSFAARIIENRSAKAKRNADETSEVTSGEAL